MRKNYKTNRPIGFHGYFVDIPEGGDAMRAYRKMKKWIKKGSPQNPKNKKFSLIFKIFCQLTHIIHKVYAHVHSTISIFF